MKEREKGTCERCGKHVGFCEIDYCPTCSKDLCDECMAKGCCGKVPCPSGMEEDLGNDETGGMQVMSGEGEPR